MIKKPTALPPGLYAQVTMDLIERGKFKARIDKAIARAYTELADHHVEMGERKGSCTVTAKVTVMATPKTAGDVTIKTKVILTTPDAEHNTSARTAGGRMICSPDGGAIDDPYQLALFDEDGKPHGTMDITSGELIDPPDDTAGKIGG